MTGDDPESDNQPSELPLVFDLRRPGWRFAPGQNGGSYFLLDTSHPDYPNSLRRRTEAQDAHIFGADPRVQETLDRLYARFATVDQHLLNLARRDPRAITAAVGQVAELLVSAVDAEVNALGPKKTGRRLFAYLLRRVHEHLPLLSDEAANALNERLSPYTAPFIIMVNIGGVPQHPQLFPYETALHFDRLPTSDLPKLGRVITEAQAIAGQAEHGKGGRPKLPAISHEAATPETVAKLRHWERWSYRRIAAFFGWLRPDEDWDDDKVRRRVGQHVRRWVREGEAILRTQTPPDQDWRQRPDHLAKAIEEGRLNLPTRDRFS